TVTVPAYGIVRGELNQQLSQRLQDGLRHSQTILVIEKREMENIVTLAAQRPTLQRLLSEQLVGELQTYLDVFQANTPLDQLYVTDLSGHWLAGTAQNEQAIALVSTAPVSDIGFVVGGIFLDEEFAQRLQQQTGFRYE